MPDKIKRSGPYSTVYHKTLNHEVPEDYIAYSYIDLIVDYITERINTTKKDIEISVSNGDYDIKISPNSLESVFVDAAKYDRKIVSFWVKSNIKHWDASTHGSVEISIRLKQDEGYPRVNTVVVTVYGVSEDRKSSQRIIDWGNGTLKGFEELLCKKQSPVLAEYVVSGGSAKALKYGELVGKNDTEGMQTVRLAEPIEVRDKGLMELRKPQVYIPIILTFIGIIIAVITLVR